MKALPTGLNPRQNEIVKLTFEDPNFLDEFLFIINAANHFVSGFIRFISAGVVDVLEGRKVADCDEIERTRALCKFLTGSIDVSAEAIAMLDFEGPVTKPIIEHQPSKIGQKTNNKSTMVGHQLMFYYNDWKPVIVNPRLKNNIALADHLAYKIFLDREIPRHKSHKDAVYAARKTHSRANFLYLLKIFDLEYILEGVPKSCYDDLADSCMQILAYIVDNKLFI
jgi:hypothetical protein